MTTATTALTTAALKAEIAGAESWLKTYGTTGMLSAATRRKLAALKAELATR